MKWWKCYNCLDNRNNPGKAFESDKPVCPDCGIDGTVPRWSGKVVPMSMIHYDPPMDRPASQHHNHAACDSRIKTFTDDAVMLTGERIAVTCPACKETEAFKGSPAELELPAGKDFEMTTKDLPRTAGV